MTVTITITADTAAQARAEAATLATCEAVIRQHVRALSEVGDARAWIRDGRLYREKYPTFGAYLEGEWQIGTSHAYRLIAAASVVRELSPTGDVLPGNEAQARAVLESSDDPAERAAVWTEAVQREGGQPAPASRVKEVADEFRAGRNPDGSPNPFAGEADAAAAFMADFRGKREDNEAPRLDIGSKPAKKVESFGDGDEFFTPARFAEAAREVMGGIELDPASCFTANLTIGAARFYVKDDNGLGQAPWACSSLWLNPPYSETGKWVDALEASYVGGYTDQAIVLVNAKTETAWFETLWNHAVVCFVRGRISFNAPDGSGGIKETGTGHTGSVIAYFPLGDADETERLAVARFRNVFGKFGRIVDARSQEAANDE